MEPVVPVACLHSECSLEKKATLATHHPKGRPDVQNACIPVCKPQHSPAFFQQMEVNSQWIVGLGEVYKPGRVRYVTQVSLGDDEVAPLWKPEQTSRQKPQDVRHVSTTTLLLENLHSYPRNSSMK